MYFLNKTSRFILLLVTFTLFNFHAQAAEKDKIPQLSLTGVGDVRASPDMALITTGVIIQASTAKDALAKNSKKMALVFSSLKNLGIDKKDIQTSNFNVGPRYKYSKDGTPPRIIGYQVTNQVSVRVREMSKLGGILDQVAQVGANKIGGIRFTHSNMTELRDKARNIAVKDALRKATLYTEGTGTKLVRILSISENFHAPRPIAMSMERSAKLAHDVPIASGENTIRTQVNIVWEIQ